MTDRDTLTRRSVLVSTGATSVLVATGLAGCLDGNGTLPLTDDDDTPEPHVVREEPDRDVSRMMPGETVEVSVLVHNAGTAGGDINITVETQVGEAETVDSTSEVVFMDGQSQEAFSINLTVSAATQRVVASAEPVVESE